MSRAENYARMFDAGGRRVTLERPAANQAPVVVSNVRARIRDASEDEIAGGVKSTERKVLLLAEDIPVSFRPLRKGDQILIDGLRLTFTARPDDQSHRDGDILLAIAGLVTGA